MDHQIVAESAEQTAWLFRSGMVDNLDLDHILAKQDSVRHADTPGPRPLRATGALFGSG